MIKKYLYVLSLFFTFVIFFLTTNVYAHEHTDDCYTIVAHEHTEDCYKKVYHQHTLDCCIKSCDGTRLNQVMEIQPNVINCTNTNCETNSNHSENITNNIMVYSKTCLTCGATSRKYVCGICGQTIKDENLSHNSITLEYSIQHQDTNIICGKSSDAYEKELICTKIEEGRKLICDKTIKNILPKEQIQNGTLDSSVIITYMDDHTELKKVLSNYDKNKTYNNDEVILTYGNMSCIVFFTNDELNDKSKEYVNENLMNNDNIFLTNDENLSINIDNNVLISTTNDETIILDEDGKGKDANKENFSNDFKTKTIALEKDIDESSQKIKASSSSIFSYIIRIFVATIVGVTIICIVVHFKKGKRK